MFLCVHNSISLELQVKSGHNHNHNVKKKNSLQVRSAIMGRNCRGGFGGILPNGV